MSNKYYSILTKIGQAQFANTAALGNKLKLKTIKVGDGGDDNGEETFPKEIDTKLVRERWNGAINDLYINPENRNWLVIEAVIPDEVGGFYITEFGLYDDQDNLVAIGKYPKTYKPNITEGSGSSLFLRVMLQVSNASQVELSVDPAIMLASKKYVETVFSRKTDSLENNSSEILATAKAAYKLNNKLSTAQFLPYDPKRRYRTGEICTVELNDQVIPMQMYAGPNLTCKGIDPSNITNRHDGWSDSKKPFWWIPYGGRVGMPFYWLSKTPPEEAVMEMNVNLPVEVYWRLAKTYPHLVKNNHINTGEIRGEFIRVWDNGRGVDVERNILSYQNDQIKWHHHDFVDENGIAYYALNDGNNRKKRGSDAVGTEGPDEQNNDCGINHTRKNNPNENSEKNNWKETRPRNIARAMAIYI
ncbi:phage tail protein [Zooshikella marina]|uniref:phage tail protein n=1 Tax=Zooshikella ganghwensis TaxID=202772 RepID=UPI001BAF12F8|nr:phage tail protein [Zooshikella ganghwensis]MBU2706483.1 phage tail protein [Zooshikella ganghwensis]